MADRGDATDAGDKRRERPRGKPTRRESPLLKVLVTPEEKAEIERRAKQAGLSRSMYLRRAGLGYPINSVYDLDAVADLAKVNGDLGRVAGLLKQWLAEQRGKGASAVEVEQVMQRFRELQTELAKLMQQALK